MQNPTYDEKGGIIDILENTESKKNVCVKNTRNGYNFFEQLLLKYSKRVNYLLDENRKYKCRQEKIPQVLRIGPTNRCAARCFYCPREHVHKNGTGYMDFYMFEKIMEWARKNNVKKISFALFGEPLLHPRILDMFKMVKDSGMKMNFSSNGIVLKKELADELMKYDFEDIEFSMDGFSREEYLVGKQIDKYDEAKENILYFLEKSKEKKSKTIFNIHFVDIGHVSFAHKIRFIKYWQEKLKGLKSATSFYYEPHNWAGTTDDLKNKMSFIDRILSKFELKKPCRYIKGLNINWNGDVLICTNDPTQEAILGNINEKSIEDVYNNEKRMKYLNENETGHFAETNCGACTVNSVLPFMFVKKRIINYVATLFI
ncbi:MAG: radical SAM protein [bacterium]